MTNNFCPNCGAQMTNRGTGPHNFCPSCGARIANKFDAAPAEAFNLVTAYKSMFKKYAQFNGRSRRSEYWYATLANSLISAIAYLFMLPAISEAANQGYVSDGKAILAGIAAIAVIGYAVAVIIPTLAMSVRRLHDVGKSGWFMLLAFIPYIGAIILFVFMVLDSQPGANQYGTNPKEEIPPSNTIL